MKILAVQAVTRAVDGITRPIRRINERVRALVAPVRRATDVMRRLGRASGINALAGRVRALARSVGGLARQMTGVLGISGAIGSAAAVAGITRLISSYTRLGDSVGKAARRLGIGVRFLQQIQFAAEREGVAPEKVNRSLNVFSRTVGELRAGQGAMFTLLNRVSPALLRQLQQAQNNEEAFLLISDAIARIEDPARRAALANAAFGRSGVPLLNLLGRGRAGIRAYAEEAERLGFILSEEQTDEAEAAADSFTNFGRVLQGVRNIIGSALLPVVRRLTVRLTQWVLANRDLIRQRIDRFVERLARFLDRIDFDRVLGGIRRFFEDVGAVVDAIGGWRNALIALAAIMAGPLIGAVVTVGGALAGLAATLLANPILALIALVAGAAFLIIDNWSGITGFFDRVLGRMGRNFRRSVGQIVDILGRLNPIPLIVRVWRGITGFFERLWDGVTGVFRTGFLGRMVRLFARFNPVAVIVRGFRGLVSFLGELDLFAAGERIVTRLWDGIRAIFARLMAWARRQVQGIAELLDSINPFGGSLAAGLANVGTGGTVRTVPDRAGLGDARRAAAGTVTGRVEGTVTVRLENAPPGTRVTTQDRSSTGVRVRSETGTRRLPGGD